MDYVAEQIEQEELHSAASRAKVLQELAEAMQAGDLEKLPKTKLLIGNAFPIVRDYIEAEQAKTIRGAGARVRNWLRAVPADVAAVLALNASLRLALGAGFKTLDGKYGATFQRIAVSIARDWVYEIQIRQAEKVNPAYYQAAMRGLDDANVSSAKHIRMTVARVIRNTLDDVYENPLTQTDLVQLGKFGLEAVMATGMLEVQRSTGSNGHIVAYTLAPQIMAFLGDTALAMRMAPANHKPMLAPPLPWTGIAGGGFYTEERQVRSPLVEYRRRVRRSRMRAYKQACSEMPLVLRYTNYVQAVPYVIDRDTFAHVDRVWRNGGAALGLPATSGPVAPEFPFPDSWSKDGATEAELEEFQAWKRRKTNWHEKVRKHKSLVWEMLNFAQTARAYGDRPLYFPVFLDTRGRLYYRCAPTPQGSDAAKGCLHFHRKRPLGARGVFWLKVHIANCFGFDKASFAERAAWTDEHWPRLAQGLERPEEAGTFEKADSPICALSACLELSKALASGNPATYETGLVVHMDATCSGLQHFSALLGDPIGGRYVNLTGSHGQKADIYRRVAELALEQATQDAGRVPEAAEWVRLGVSRDLAKKPVMTYVYGATLLSVKNGIEDWLDEEGWKHPAITRGQMSSYLAKCMFRSIEATVPAAAEAMRWLRSLMKQMPRDDAVQWVTPLGFTVNHDYQDEERIRVRVRSTGVDYVVMYNRLDSCALSRMQNAISPNFVHSLDATHLGMTALRMQDAGLDMACIHDSFGTHPSDVDTMHRCIREAFVHLYSRDLLGELVQQLGLDVPAPARGTLNIADVLDSEFFFC